jgi:N-methylhydantoinase B
MKIDPLRLDPIEIEILRNAFSSITDETFASLTKSAFSTNIKERKDHSTAIVDARGRLIAQTMASPIHIASMTGLMATMMARHAGPDGSFPGIEPGDIFIANDPHVAGGTHLPDVNMATPIFQAAFAPLSVTSPTMPISAEWCRARWPAA